MHDGDDDGDGGGVEGGRDGGGGCCDAWNNSGDADGAESRLQRLLWR